jgi:hypothetical protein
MRDVQISCSGTKKDYKKASDPSSSMAARTLGVAEPAMDAWFNRKPAMLAVWSLHRN